MGPGGGMQPESGGSIAYLEDDLNQFIGGLSVSKSMGRFLLRSGGIYSNLNKTNQLTASAGLIWYPLGNLDIYIGGSLNAHSPDLNGGGFNLVQDFMFGYGIASKVWIDITAAGGDMRNYSESNAYVIYNGIDWVRYKVTGSITLPFTEKGSKVYIGGRYADYGNTVIGSDLQPLIRDEVFNRYHSISLYGGLVWNF
jgi:hypothetical protein